jgi:hypothetical protein
VIPSFSNLLDRLKGLFSQDFLLVGLFPTLLFTALSAAWAYWSWPSLRPGLDALVLKAPTRQLPYWLAGALGLVVVAFVLWSLNPVMRRFLEGEILLPKFVRRWLESRQQWDWQRLEGERRSLHADLFSLRKAHNPRTTTWEEQLRAAAPPAGQRQKRTYQIPSDLRKELKRLSTQRARRQLICFQDLDQFRVKLLAELQKKSANEMPELDKMKRDFKDLACYALDRVENEHDRLRTTIRAHFPEEGVRLAPSRMGNVGQLHREYCWLRYQMDIEPLWPRLLKLARADQSFYPILEGAKTQLDFAVVMCFISTLFTAVWSTLALSTAAGLAPYFTVVLLGPLCIYLFYRLAVANYQAFGEALRSAVDLFRFDLLKALHLDLPGDEAAERNLWSTLALDPHVKHDPLKYRHS